MRERERRIEEGCRPERESEERRETGRQGQITVY